MPVKTYGYTFEELQQIVKYPFPENPAGLFEEIESKP
jgi:hypothetical protein